MRAFKDADYMKIMLHKNLVNSSSRIAIPRKLENVYSEVYMFTNENIKEYLPYVDFQKGQKALSVLASGDHAFNLIHQGILDIDTFDLNKFTEYYALGFKRALILKYDYEKFLFVYEIIKNPNTSYNEIAEIITDILPEMEKRHRDFWKAILNYYRYISNKGHKENIFLSMLMGWVDYADKPDGNIYLKDETAYNIVKKALPKANITFKNTNATNLKEVFKGKYDFLLLSNILDYFYRELEYNWDAKHLFNYVNLLENLMNEGGIIFLHYCFHNIQKEPIFNSNISLEHLRDFEIIKFKDKQNKDTEAMILKRVSKGE